MRQNTWHTVAFLDSNPNLPASQMGLTVHRGEPHLVALASRYPDAVVAIGDAMRRLELMQELRNFGFNLAIVCHPSASISTFSEIGAGSVILAQAAVNPGAKLGAGCIINTGATVDHDCILADGVHVSPGAHLAGGVKIGHASWLGIGSSVREGVSIGDHVTVGAGAAVVRDVPDNTTVVGVPAAPIGA
jgi:sugar O-acyltransferase (sialic acid O-acetyltransferase NeuD family)